MTRSVRLGTFTGQGTGNDTVSLLCEHPDLRRHLHKPWCLSYLSQNYKAQYGDVLQATTIEANVPNAAPNPVCAITEDTFARHAVLCGASGSGKTRLMVHLLSGQLPWGCSLIAIDPKKETLLRLLHAARASGIPESEICLLLPSLDGDACPGWNPLHASPGVTLSAAVQGFVSIVKSCSDSWGPRLGDVLKSTALLIGAHGLTLLELVRFLQRSEYREAILALPLPDLPRGDALALGEAREFFDTEYALWSNAEKAANVAPVLNKIRDLIAIPFLRALFCARDNFLDLSSLWKRQRVVLIHLDAPTLGDDGTKLLAGLLLHSLFNTATRAPGQVPVALAVDELGLSERFAGQALCRILAAAREYKLRLMVACQHMGQLSHELQEALRTSTALRVYFRIGFDDAKQIASSLSAGRGGALKQVSIEPTPPEKGLMRRKDEMPEPYQREVMSHTVLDGEGRALSRSPQAEAVLRSQTKAVLSGAGKDAETLPVAARNLRMLAVASGVPRVYVRDPLTWELVEAGAYVRGVQDDEVSLSGGYPVELTVSFPRPRIGKADHSSETEITQGWIRTLLNMPVQQAVVWADNDAPTLVRVDDVPDALRDTSLSKYLESVLQNWRERLCSPEETEEWRKGGMEETVQAYRKHSAAEVPESHEVGHTVTPATLPPTAATRPVVRTTFAEDTVVTGQKSAGDRDIKPVVLTPRQPAYGEQRTLKPTPKTPTLITKPASKVVLPLAKTEPPERVVPVILPPRTPRVTRTKSKPASKSKPTVLRQEAKPATPVEVVFEKEPTPPLIIHEDIQTPVVPDPEPALTAAPVVESPSKESEIIDMVIESPASDPVSLPPVAPKNRSGKKTPVLSPEELTKSIPEAYEMGEDGSLA